ncbi:MAG: pyridoxamine 5'-phosphate oxidase family protein [Actinomycetota bacterium]
MARYRNFHEGEARLQSESGVDTALFDQMVEEPFRPALSPTEARFVAARTFSVAATIDGDGRSWASPLFGAPNALFTVTSPTSVRIAPEPTSGDPLFDAVSASGELGVLYFDPSRRRRAKSLGRATVGSTPGTLDYETHRNFGLCTKYIARRAHTPGEDASEGGDDNRARARVDHRLDAADRRQLSETDTLFLASFHSEHGADPTHRGGPPGFVKVVDDATIRIPDYLGNGMFQTLGNLLLNPRIGLLSVDFGSGRALQITGRGAIGPGSPHDLDAERTLEITIEEVRTTWPRHGQWTFLEAYEFRPGLRNPATPYLPTISSPTGTP